MIRGEEGTGEYEAAGSFMVYGQERTGKFDPND